MDFGKTCYREVASLLWLDLPFMLRTCCGTCYWETGFGLQPVSVIVRCIVKWDRLNTSHHNVYALSTLMSHDVHRVSEKTSHFNSLYYHINKPPSANIRYALSCVNYSWTMCFKNCKRLIIGSDRRSETKQGKIVRFRSCLRHFRFIISCRRHFVQFVLNFIHVIPKKGVIWRL